MADAACYSVRAVAGIRGEQRTARSTNFNARFASDGEEQITG